MTFINWIGLGVTGLLLVTGLLVKRYTKQKMEDLDGFCGISSKNPPGE